MVKKYVSKMNNFVTEGIVFMTRARNIGSYYITSNKEEQKRLESSPFFGRVFKLEPIEEAPAKVVVEKKVEKPTNVFETSSLQEARRIVMAEREKRNMPYKNFPNAKSVMKAAAELEIEFPNIKTK